MNDDKTCGATEYSVEVPEDKAGMRLDRLLADCIEGISRTRIKALIEAGHIRGEKSARVTDPSARVRTAQTFTITVPQPDPAIPQPQDIALDIIYEDEHLIIIDKPQGMVVHPAPGHPDATLVNALLAHCSGELSGIGGVSRPGIVHRLDKDTGGLMVAAKSEAAHLGLSEQFAAHTVERAYYAVVWGIPYPRSGKISGNIGRSPANRKKMAVLERGGKSALTNYKVMRTFAVGTGRAASLIECRLATGRTHQIRVHLATMGFPVIGDPLYGGGRKHRLKGAPKELVNFIANYKRQALCAYLIGFNHPIHNKYIKFNKEIPPYINRLTNLLEL